ncbi:protein-lysine methyltransferase mettl21a-like [Nannochloropsis oceanica]
MSSSTSSLPAKALQAPPPPVPNNGTSDSEDEGDLLEELWPRETKPLLMYQMTFSNGASVDLPIVQDLMGRRYEMGIGNIVWDAAVAMHRFFQVKFPPGHFQGKTILELGSGTGLVGITLALLGAQVILTDLPDFLPILQHNVSTSLSSLHPATLASLPYPLLPPLIEPLTWGEALPPSRLRIYDYVIGSDITYCKEHLDELLATLTDAAPPSLPPSSSSSSSFSSSSSTGDDAVPSPSTPSPPFVGVVNSHTTVYIGHLERGDEHGFFERLAARGMEVVEVWKEDVGEGGVARKLWVHVFRARRKEGGKEYRDVEGQLGDTS